MLARPVVACSKVALLASTTVSMVPISESSVAISESIVAIAAMTAVNAPASGRTSVTALIAVAAV